MKGLVLSFAFLVASLAAHADVAHAETEWCAEDPVLIVDGRTIDITTSFDRAYLGSIRDAILFEIQVPENVAFAAAVGVAVFVPHEVSIARTLPVWDGDGPMPLVARVTVRADAAFDTFTRITGSTAITEVVQGRSNSPTKLAVGTLAP